MQLSLEYLRKAGYVAEVTERWVPVVKGPQRDDDTELVKAAKKAGGFKRDLFGFVDIVAIKRGVTLAVQTTTAPNVSTRVHKIQCLAEFEWCKRAGWQIHVHGWAAATKAGGLKVIDMTTMETLWSSIVLRGARNKRTPRVQTTLEL